MGQKLTNEFRVGYTDGGPVFSQTSNLPSDFIITGLPFGLTDPLPSFQDQGRATEQITIQNNASYSFGNHTMRFGINYINQKIGAFNDGATRARYALTSGNTSFSPIPTGLFPGGASGTVLGRVEALRGLLGGVIGGGSQQANFQGAGLGPVLGAPSGQNFRYDTWGLYFSDQWRLKPNLTMTLGLRWDYWTPLRNPEQVYLEPDLAGVSSFNEAQQALLNPNGRLTIIGNNSGKPGEFYKPDFNNFGPNIGLAWSPSFEKGPLSWMFGSGGQSTIRGGFRIGYINDEFVRGSDNALGANSGLDFSVSARQNGSTTLNARFNNLPGFVLPAFQSPPISFATANANSGSSINTVFGVDPNLQMQQNYEYSVGFQRDIGWNTAIEIRYVGGASNNMHQGFDFNQVNINNNNFLGEFLAARNNCRLFIAQNNANQANSTRFLDGRCSTTEYRGTAANAPSGIVDLTGTFTGATVGSLRTTHTQGVVGEAARVWTANRGFLAGIGGLGLSANQFLANNNAGNVDYLTNSGKYRYNSLQLEIRRRFSDGLQFQANYNFQKILTDSGGDSQGRFSAFLDINNRGLEYQRADYDRTHTVNMNVNYELPFGKGKAFFNRGGIVDKIVGGWQITGISNISSGAPISIKDRNGTLNRSGRSGRQTANSSLTPAEIKKLVGLNFVNGNVFFIDPSVIGPNGAATNGNVEATPDSRFPGQVFFRVQPGQTGNLPRAFLNGPWYFNMDVGIIKNISFGERFRVQLRAEAFNVLNNTNWFIGQNTNTFTIDDSTGNTFGQIPISNTFSPRIMQFAFRLEF